MPSCDYCVCRFSLLLLEFGEIYFEDFSANYYPSSPSDAEAIERLTLRYYCLANILIKLLSFQLGSNEDV